MVLLRRRRVDADDRPGMISRIRLSVASGISVSLLHPEAPCALEPWQDGHGREQGFALWQENQYLLKVHQIGAFLLRPGDWEVTAFPEDGVGLPALREAFFHGVIPWILQRGQWDCLHGSAVLVRGGVLAFCGPSGRGKSTLVRAWQDRGGVPYADDTVAFLVREGKAMAAQIPQRLRLRDSAARHYGAAPGPSDTEPAGLEIAHNLESTLRPLRGIYYLEPRRERNAVPMMIVERVPGREAFRLLLDQARSLSLDNPDLNRKMVRNYLSLVHLAPVFRLAYASGLSLLPDVVEKLEQHQENLSTL